MTNAVRCKLMTDFRWCYRIWSILIFRTKLSFFNVVFDFELSGREFQIADCWFIGQQNRETFLPVCYISKRGTESEVFIEMKHWRNMG